MAWRLSAVAAIAYAIAFRDRCWVLLTRAVAGTFEARNAWLICLAHGPLLFTVAAYLFANVRITGGFLTPAFFAVPIVLLVLSQADVSIGVLRRLSYCVAAVWLSLLIASPFLGYRTFAHAHALGLDPVGRSPSKRQTFGAVNSTGPCAMYPAKATCHRCDIL